MMVIMVAIVVDLVLLLFFDDDDGDGKENEWCVVRRFSFLPFCRKARFEKKLARVVRHIFKFCCTMFLRINIRNSNGKLWREAKNEY